MKKYIKILLLMIFVILEIFLLINSKEVINSFNKTFNICIYTLMPTLFFSLIFSYIIINLLNLKNNNLTIFILSMLCGYPNNSKLLINNRNVNNVIQYTNFVNPLYLLCTVNTLYLKNIKVTLIILISHYLSNILLYFLLKNKNIKEVNKKESINNTFFNIYSNSLKSAIYTLSIIFSNILFFSIILSLITNIIKLNEPYNSILIGLIEFSSGIYNISQISINMYLKGLIILIIITFGSFSIHFQILSINDKIKYIKYLLYRIFNVFISCFIYLLIYYFINV